MKHTFKVACVGAGYFSRFHLDAWRRIEAVDLAGISDIDLVAAERTGLPAFCDLEQMIRDLKPDVLDIIVPPDAQAGAIRTALALGVKTVICQKPFCASLGQAEQIVETAEEAGAMLIVHENFRFMPWYRYIKKALQEGLIGTPLQATFRLRPGDGQGPDAYLDRQPYFQTMHRFLVQETAVHWVDVFRFLLGEPVSVYADLRQINPAIAGEDAGIVLFEHRGGLRAVFDGNRLLDHASDNLRRTMGEALFEGTDGTLELFGDGRITHRRFGAYDSRTVLPADTWDGFGGDCVYALQSHVIHALATDTAPENLASDYCTVLRTRDAIYQSAETGSKIMLAHSGE